MQEKILNLLGSKTGYISGEEISDKLSISRQALWKHIQDLREDGYDIIAVPHLGYQLLSSPDRLFPFLVNQDLRTEFIGRKIYYHQEISSTMDEAMRLGLEGAPEGSVVLSETQKKGRGRLGREWSSPKFKGVYLSLMLRPKIAPSQISLLTLLAAVSVCQAIKEVTAEIVQIKWPNDLLIHHKKVGGILTELNAEMDKVKFIIIGIGINVNNDKKSLPVGATSLKEQLKQEISRIRLLQEILLGIEINYKLLQKEGGESIISKWREYNITLGRRVRIQYQNRQIEGEAADIDKDGALLLRSDSGLTQRVTAGDIVHCR